MSNPTGNRSDYGILAIEIYFPSQYVDQTELEVYDGVSSGKYTVGLGQQRMAFCSDVEDVNSLCLTVVHNLMERHSVDYGSIGRLEVGTETLVDKSKSVKSVLMQLFADAAAAGSGGGGGSSGGVSDVEGVDCTNACYGGTAALFNALDWLQGAACHNRLALVVCADIAVYDSGPARPTGGAGAVAMLVGPGAPLVIESELRSSCMQHVYDFYKPDLSSEYPVVDGRLSIQCYLSALDGCYRAFKKRSQLIRGESISVDSFDAVIFHCPFGKLVQKSLARLVFNDFLQWHSKSQVTAGSNDSQVITGSNDSQVITGSNVKQMTKGSTDSHVTKVPNGSHVTEGSNNSKATERSNDSQMTTTSGQYSTVLQFADRRLEQTYFDKDVEKAFLALSAGQFDAKTRPSLALAANIGNMYTPSVYSCLVSLLLSKPVDQLAGSRVCVFSYGSGLASSMYSIKCATSDSRDSRDTHYSLQSLVSGLDTVFARLDSRHKLSPDEFVSVLTLRKDALHKAPYTPRGCVDHLFAGTYHLTHIDDKFRRFYRRHPDISSTTTTTSSSSNTTHNNNNSNSHCHDNHNNNNNNSSDQQNMTATETTKQCNNTE